MGHNNFEYTDYYSIWTSQYVTEMQNSNEKGWMEKWSWSVYGRKLFEADSHSFKEINKHLHGVLCYGDKNTIIKW